MGVVRCLCEATMLLTILLLSLLLPSLTDAGGDAKPSPKQGLEDSLENLVEKLVESRLRDLETRMRDDKEKEAEEKKELEAKVKEMEAKHLEMERRVKELEDKMKEVKSELEASTSKLRTDEEESSRKEVATNITLTNPSPRDLPIVLISARRHDPVTSPQTVTFESFLSNFNNANRPGGGDGVLDLDSGIFTCFTTGYYTVSFSAYASVGNAHGSPFLYLYKNDVQLPESIWVFGSDALNDIGNIGVTGSRILILHMDAGDTLELRLTGGTFISLITFNIELIV